MINLEKIWNFFVADFIPGLLLTLNIYMIIDIVFHDELKSLSLFSAPFIYLFIIFAIIFGILQSTIVFWIFKNTLYKILKIRFKNPLNPGEEKIWTIHACLSNLIIPTLLCGMLFPKYVSRSYLQPWFFLVFLALSFLLLIVSIQPAIWCKEGVEFTT